MVSSISSMSNSQALSILAARQSASSRRGPKIDTDGDGAVSKDEFTAFAADVSKMSGTEIDAEKLFSTYDADSSGSLDDSEMQALFESGDLPKPPPPPDLQSAEDNMLQQLLAALDTDEDGAVSKSELKDYIGKLAETGASSSGASATDEAGSIVASYDEDQSGDLSAAELETFVKDNLRADGPPPPPPPQQASASGAGEDAEEELTLIEQLMQAALDSYRLNSGVQQTAEVFNAVQ